jgi:hypothetical protein
MMNWQVMATYLLHPLASSRLMLVVRSLLAILATLTFSIALVTGIISRHILFSFNHNPAGLQKYSMLTIKQPVAGKAVTLMFYLLELEERI